MKSGEIAAMAAVIVYSVTSVLILEAQDKYSLKAPNGIAFSEFRGYETWETVAPSQTDEGIKSILANPVMIKAYQAGIPGNGQPFPDGSKIVKIEWYKKANLQSPYAVMTPADLKSISFIEKDSKRFPDTSGWGYAQFLYDPKSNTFKPFGNDSAFGKTVCYQCHTRVTAQDYIFTAYPLR